MAADSVSVVNYYQFLGLKDFESNITLIKKHCDKKIAGYERSEPVNMEKIKFVQSVYRILRDASSRTSYDEQLASFPEKLQRLIPQIRSERNHPEFFSKEKFVFYTYISIRQYFGLDEKDPINAEQVKDFKLFVSNMLKVFPEKTQVLPDDSIRVSAAAHSFLISTGCVGFSGFFSSFGISSKAFPHLELQEILESTKKLLDLLKTLRKDLSLKEKQEFIEAFKFLISRRPYLVITDNKGWNVLHSAIYFDLTELVSLVLESASKAQKEQLLKAETYKSKNTPIMIAKKKGSSTMIELLEDSASQCIVNFNLRFSDELIPLVSEEFMPQDFLQKNKKTTELRHCLVELKNSKGLTQLDEAALIEKVQELIKSDRALSLVTMETGWNILHIAVARNLEGMVDWIRKNIPVVEQQQLLAGKTLRSKITPLDMAKDRDNKPLIEMLTDMQTCSVPLTQPDRAPLATVFMPVNRAMSSFTSKLAHPSVVNPHGFHSPTSFLLNERKESISGPSNVPAQRKS